jgi:hypothetical protein
MFVPALGTPAEIAAMVTPTPAPELRTARADAFVDDSVGDVLIGASRKAVATNESVVLYLFATSAVAPGVPRASA